MTRRLLDMCVSFRRYCKIRLKSKLSDKRLRNQEIAENNFSVEDYRIINIERLFKITRLRCR